MLLERSRVIYEKYPENGVGLARSLAHLGSVHKNLGEYETARDLFEKVLQYIKNTLKSMSVLLGFVGIWGMSI